jgi:hypothetical protein
MRREPQLDLALHMSFHHFLSRASFLRLVPLAALLEGEHFALCRQTGMW